VNSSSTLPLRLRFIEHSPVPGLAVAERRVKEPHASVICVHGALDRGGSFARLARRLESFDLITYDRRGYQGSRALAPFDLNHHIDDLIELVAHESLTLPVILVGHSFGGVITFGAALREPSHIKLVVNYESPFPWLVRRDRTRTRSDDASSQAEHFFRRVVSDKAWERLSEQQRESRRLDEPALVNDLATIHQGALPYDLATLRIPAAYVHGDDVHTDYYRRLAGALHALNPHKSQNEIEHASHDAHLKKPDQLANVIRQRWEETCASA
jgi:pimeloyl-ACP methyl ester carboxylesterase